MYKIKFHHFIFLVWKYFLFRWDRIAIFLFHADYKLIFDMPEANCITIHSQTLQKNISCYTHFALTCKKLQHPCIRQVVWRLNGHCAVHLPALSSFLQLFSSDPLLQVFEFPAGLNLKAKLTFIFWRAYNITKEQGNIEPSRLCEVHQVYDHTWGANRTQAIQCPLFATESVSFSHSIQPTYLSL